MSEVLFPTGAEPYGEVIGLAGLLCSFFGSCLDVDKTSLILMTASVLSTWVPEKLPLAPYLSFVGPPDSGKTTALRILSLVCRRSLSTSDLTSAGFYDVCHRLHPTLVIDETRTAANQRTLLHLLRSSNTRGFMALRKGKAQLAYGPKIVSWVELPDDGAFNSRCIILPMHRTTRTALWVPEDPRALQVATRLRKCLLQFRFEHYRSLSLEKIPPDARLSSRCLDLYRALALPFAEHSDICKLLAQAIMEQRKFRGKLLSAFQESALRVLYRLIHDCPNSAGFTVSGITVLMGSDLASRGEPSQGKERKVGDVLTSLGLTNRSRANPGLYTLWLDRADRVKIHEKVVEYDVDGVSTGPFPSCKICLEKKRGVPEGTSQPEPVAQKPS